MKATTEQLERFQVEIMLGIPKDKSKYAPLGDLEADYDALAASMAQSPGPLDIVYETPFVDLKEFAPNIDWDARRKEAEAAWLAAGGHTDENGRVHPPAPPSLAPAATVEEPVQPKVTTDVLPPTMP